MTSAEEATTPTEPTEMAETTDQADPVETDDSDESAEPALTDPAAVVNGTTIDYAALKRAQQTLPLRPLPLTEPSEETLSEEELALEQLIHRQLLYEAAVAQKITVDSNQVDETFTRFLRRLPGPRAYETILSRLDMTEEDLKKELARDFAIEAFINQFTADITMAPEKVETYYVNHPHLFAEDAKIRFREIYLPKTEPPDIDTETKPLIIDAELEKTLHGSRRPSHGSKPLRTRKKNLSAWRTGTPPAAK